MKQFAKRNLLPLSVLAAGILGFSLRSWLFATGMDEKGLLSTTHPANFLLPILLAAVLVALFLGTKNLPCPTDYLQLFPRSAFRAMGNWAAGVGFLYYGISLYLSAKNLPYIFLLLSALIAICFAYLGYCCLKGIRPYWMFRGFAAFCFAFHLFFQYALYATNPQLGQYAYEVLAFTALTFACYYHTTLNAHLHGLRHYVITSLAAIFLCCLCLTGQNRLFYLAMALYCAADFCHLPDGYKAAAMALPRPILSCMKKLEDAGFQAYAVGGCVRDSLLGISPQDYDLCTNATPEDICRVFSESRLVRSGEKHGTIGVILEDGVCEITTFRTESTYTDNRHPDAVCFVTTVEEDLRRRDFTVNAMAYSPATGYIDPWKGQVDLRNYCLRAVGDPYARFREDALRILRGVRFSIRFCLTPETKTEKAMTELAPLMDNLARERVFDELCKLLPLATAEDLLRFAPILTQVIPELKPTVMFHQHSRHHSFDVYAHTAYVVEAAPMDLAIRWAALLHDIGKPATYTIDEHKQGHFYDHAKVSAEMANDILLRLKAPTALREQVVFLIAHHMLPLEPDKKTLLRRLGKYGAHNLTALLALQKADVYGKRAKAKDTHIFSETEVLLSQLLQESHCLSAKDLAITGRDILALGVAPGPLVGECMTALLAQVQEESLPNTKEALLEAARSFLREKHS